MMPLEICGKRDEARDFHILLGKKKSITFLVDGCSDRYLINCELQDVKNRSQQRENLVHFTFRRFRSGIFDVKDALRTGRPVVESVDKITEIIEVDRHVSSRSIAQELKIDHKTVLNHLHKTGFKKKLGVWGPHQLTPKNIMDRISICEALANRNEIDPFLKRMMTGDEKWVTYDNFVRKRSWSKRGEAAQTMAKPGLTTRKVLLCIWWD
ncbi:histone-lysine N-methyltransferase SETMAR-like [Vespa crabro]|uniref:histone-lysine N-methyltransferase SETMAR-like n=1 Tax=Vespa crabro TaxID=7445 RepID=UPI001F02DE21|nr:histone-lysine N-methyltransferase SETMAR-like [Vespa crabro]